MSELPRPRTPDEEIIEAESPGVASLLTDAEPGRADHRTRCGRASGCCRTSGPAAVVFGSARTPSDDPRYAAAREVGRRLGEAGFAVITGGGPGIMEAANRGAVDAGAPSVGLNIELPFEQGMNQWVTLGMEFDYFFTRKLMFARVRVRLGGLPGRLRDARRAVRGADAAPDGQGTRSYPVILVGSEDWRGLRDWLRDTVLAEGRIDAADLELFHLCDDPAEVVGDRQARVRALAGA